jgi:abortive infection bacteriophage resistance protein
VYSSYKRRRRNRSHAHSDKRSYTSSFTKSVDGQGPLIAPFIEGLDRAFLHSKEEFAKHFKSKYDGHPPVWIAAGTWDWGNLSYMLGYLSDKNRDAICNAIDPNLTLKSLASWMKCLNEVRNACAHHSRLWNKPLINSPRLNPTEITMFNSLIDERGRVPDAHAKRLYRALVVMIFRMRTFYPKTQ